MAELVAWAALVFSAIAAVGVTWQIWRVERALPRFGIAVSWSGRLDAPDEHGNLAVSAAIRVMGNHVLFEPEPAVWGVGSTSPFVSVEDRRYRMDVESEPYFVSFVVPADRLEDVWVGLIWTHPDRPSPRESAERLNAGTGAHQRWVWRRWRWSVGSRRAARRGSRYGRWKTSSGIPSERLLVPRPQAQRPAPVLKPEHADRLERIHDEWR